MLVIFFGFAFLFCGGFAGLAFVGLRQMAGKRTELELPERRDDSFGSDAALFNLSLQTPDDGSDDNAELQTFVTAVLDDSQNGIEVPLNIELFIEAIGESRFNTEPLGMLDRFTLRTWLKEFAPVPTGADEHYRIVKMRQGSDSSFATVDILSYSDESQATTVQWFLAKDGDKWSVYDWQHLEYGFRTSDQYAAHLRGSDAKTEAYNDALQLIEDAYAAWENDEPELARSTLGRVTTMRLLPCDRANLLMDVAYYHMSFDDFGEALRVLKLVPNPEKRWGVWPSVAVCHYSLGQNEKAMVAIRKAERQSPNHPNVHAVLCHIHSAMGDHDLAADAAVKALAETPKDSATFSTVVQYARPKDLPSLMRIAVRENDERLWRQLLNGSVYNQEWTTALLSNVEQTQGTPVGIEEYLAGHIAWASEEYDSAAEAYLSAKQSADEDYLVDQAARWHLNARVEGESYQQLFAETSNASQVIQELVDLAFDDELYSDPDALLAAVEANPQINKIPWAKALKGWCCFSSQEFSAAQKNLESALTWINEHSEEVDEQQWYLPTIEYYIAECLLSQNQPLKTLERFPNNALRQRQIGDHLLDLWDGDQVREFLIATENLEPSEIKIQRHRLKAQQGFLSGDINVCDQQHTAAIALANEWYDEAYRYQVQNLVKQRAKQLARAQRWRKPVDTGNEDDRDTHFRSFASESAMLVDLANLERCENEAREHPDLGDDLRAQIAWDHGSCLEERGDLREATKSVEQSLLGAAASDTWRTVVRNEKLVDLHLRLGNLSNATSHADAATDDSELIPGRALIELGNGEFDLLLARLRAVPSDTAADWIASDLQQVLINRLSHSDQHAASINALSQEFAFAVSYHRPASWGELYYPAGVALNREFLSGVLNRASSGKFRVQEIDADRLDDSSSKFMIAVASTGERVLFRIRSRTFQTRLLPKQLHDAFDASVLQLSICILDDQAKSTQRLFRLAELASDKAIAFQHNRSRYLWEGTDLPNQLRWQDRMPVSSRTTLANLEEEEEEEEAENEENQEEERQSWNIQKWHAYLQDNPNPPIVQVRQHVGPVSELIPVKLISADVDQHRLECTAQSDSLVSSTIRTGMKLKCASSQLLPPAGE
ncbi:hypothetical protein K239x_30770 [Planctomycetes bacterium K23_9]|uniref:Uncharacterized protein n=2 Tax=Stieleria marina TaxID=1930275 RepID=A0A517NVE2_9BACT|nr:hypothetical protein K239x_30770 [Planctomycetes bacterium K23_9]